jgi:hypothetical protein
VTGRPRRWWVPGLVALGVVAVALVRSASLLGYSTWIVDEERIVAIAVGFIGFDLNPRWFNYHPLPMYLLGAVYHLMYLVGHALGLFPSRVAFASLLFSHDAVFYVPAKLLSSFVYTVGCAVLGLIAWRRTASRGAALLAFAAPLLLKDGINAAVQIRTDTFVFLFLAVTVYLACYAARTPRNALLAVAACAAAVASKIPAVVLVPVLFLQLGLMARRGDIRWRHVAWGALLFPVALFCFMPYAFLDFAHYWPTIQLTAQRASGELMRMDAPSRTALVEKWAFLGTSLHRNAGWLPLIGCVLYALYAAVRDRAALVPVLFVAAYATAFSTSAILANYWLRPVYPFLFLFPILLVAEVAALPRVAERWPRALARARPRCTLLGALALGYAVILGGNVPAAVEAMTPQPEDTRLIAARWIEGHLPEGTTIFLDGPLLHYMPRLHTTDPATLLWVFSYGHSEVVKNDALMAAFRHYLAHAAGTEKPFDVRLTFENDANGGAVPRATMGVGDYVVISSAYYARFYRPDAVARHPRQTRAMQAFYAFLRTQEPVAHFAGNGPTIDVYRLRVPVQVGRPRGPGGGR